MRMLEDDDRRSSGFPRLMRTDLHMHTHFSPDSEMSPQALVKRCVKVGLDCIAVTDHNTIEGAREVKPDRAVHE